MRKICTVAILGFFLFSCNGSNEKDSIVVSKASTMVEIVKTGNLPLFRQMIKEIGYMFLDSMSFKGYVYFTIDPKEKVNRLACFTDYNFKAKSLSFATSENMYVEMKKQILSLGFVTTTLDTKENSEVFEQFKKDNIEINASDKSRKGERSYQFMFTRIDTANMQNIRSSD